MHIEFFPEHHDTDNSDTTLICILTGIVFTAFGFISNAITVTSSFNFTAFVMAIVYASSGAVASYFVKMGLDAAKNALTKWYKNRDDNDSTPTPTNA
jgi:hypothetical protein